MGKIGGFVTTAIFVGGIALLVYLCCRNKRKRANWQDVFGQHRNQPGCPANPGLGPQSTVPAICPAYDHNVPHSIVSPPVVGYPSYPPPSGYPSAYPYPGNNPNQSYPAPYGATPYPLGPPHIMPMPGTTMETTQNSAPTAPYPMGYPEDLPPPYSAVVGQSGPKY